MASSLHLRADAACHLLHSMHGKSDILQPTPTKTNEHAIRCTFSFLAINRFGRSRLSQTYDNEKLEDSTPHAGDRHVTMTSVKFQQPNKHVYLGLHHDEAIPYGI